MTRAALAFCLIGILSCRSAPVEAPPALDFERTPIAVEAYLSIAEHRAARGDLPGAKRAADAAVRRRPRSGAARLAQAKFLALSGDPADLAAAQEIVTSITASDPEAPGLPKVRATTALRSGDPDAAWNELDGELATSSDPELHALAAEISLAQSDEAVAIEQADVALGLDPVNGRALAARARAHQRLGDDAAAELDARHGLRARRDDPDLRLLLVETQLRLGKPHSARASLASLDPAARSARSERLAGAIARASGDLPGARDAFERALELEPGDDEARLGLASLDLDEDATAAALSRLADDTSPEAAILRARALLADDRTDEARDELRALLRTTPDRLEPWGLLLATVPEEGSPQERAAAAWGSEANSAVPGALILHALLLDDTARAAALYDDALARDPGLAVAANNRASQLLDADEEPARALALAQTAYERSSAAPVIADTFGRALLVAGRPHDAVRILSLGIAASDPRDELSQILHARRARALLATGREDAALAAADGLLAEHQRMVRAAEKSDAPAPPDPSWLADAQAVHDQLAEPEPAPEPATPPAGAETETDVESDATSEAGTRPATDAEPGTSTDSGPDADDAAGGEDSVPNGDGDA